jgi:hypothetical protein
VFVVCYISSIKQTKLAIYTPLDQLLAELKQRVANGATFSHEIGLFIGYPAKDVAAFMGLIKLPLTCQGPWKIYGNPLESLNLVEQYRCCRQRMCNVLSSGTNKALELNAPGHLFFVILLILAIKIIMRSTNEHYTGRRHGPAW